MSQQEPTKTYVYQPDPDNGQADPRIYAVGGPGSQVTNGDRYTKAEAQSIADAINSGKLTSAMLIAIGKTPRVRSAVSRRTHR